MNIKNVVVAGGGVMGSQVSWQFATHGVEVTVYDAFEAGLERCRNFHDDYARKFVSERGVPEAGIAAARGRLSYSSDLGGAVADADIVIEQVPEDIAIKRRFWQEVSALAPQKTVFLTNTSSLLPSDMVDFVDRAEKFLALHFCVPVWDANVGEIMTQPKTDPKYRGIITDFARQVGLVPIDVRKEQPGYVLNSLLIPFLTAALDLLRRGVADAESVDQVWHICNRSEIGPCQMVDMVGMNAAYHIMLGMAKAHGDPQAQAVADYLKAEFIDKGRLGMETGQGFYTYPADGVKG